MSDASPINISAFQPFEGGQGKRLSVTTTTARTQIPGTQAVATPDRLRVLISNSGTIPVSICMGQDAVIATLDCQEVLPGTQVLFTPPVVAPDAVWIAAISEYGDGYIQVTAGYGT
jgi:hypothetical protein